ncbi:sodium:solute symporter family transporter [Parapedobacter sp. 10938]|uniref:sodium:solute symporter family transporter n=1 Tax=Parapedobacter flavus TaxID=3110225 RepID=UPI002DBE77C2|nr:sodium/solute symporter [Parapedobacter sp. 10938]MEC3878594.1 sodium/solute symporter [Parapedobacter sp. 10938]
MMLLQIDTPGLALLDWAVIGAYIMGMLWIGWHYNKKNKTQEDYLLGGRRMNPIAVGISLFATLLSTLSYLAYPGEMIKYGPGIFVGMLAFPLVYFVAGWWLIPRIRQMGVTSAYEILEKKLGVKVRMLATFMFLCLRFFWMATIIYVTVDLALMSVIPIDRMWVPVIGIIMILITIVYTVMGGLRAVVVTDVVQASIFLGGALLSVIVVMVSLESPMALIPESWPAHWSAPKIGFDLHERITFGNAMLMLFVWYVATTGSDQMAIQRYISTKDLKTARQSLRVSLFTDFTAKCILAFVGLAMLAYFSHHTDLLLPGKSLGEQADTLFPRFILLGLPSGISGLVIAGLLAAAMSSISSGLNAVSSVISEDLINRFRKKPESETNKLRQVKALTLVAGVVVLVLSLLIGYVPGNLYDVVMKVVNLLVCPLFVLFFMALFIPVATEWGTFIGGVAAVAVAVAIAYFGWLGITVLWIAPSSFVAGALVGIAASYVNRVLVNDHRIK